MTPATVEEAKAGLRRAAWRGHLFRDPTVHSVMTFGADWDLPGAIRAVETARELVWLDADERPLGYSDHELGVVDAEGRRVFLQAAREGDPLPDPPPPDTAELDADPAPRVAARPGVRARARRGRRPRRRARRRRGRLDGAGHRPRVRLVRGHLARPRGRRLRHRRGVGVTRDERVARYTAHPPGCRCDFCHRLRNADADAPGVLLVAYALRGAFGLYGALLACVVIVVVAVAVALPAGALPRGAAALACAVGVAAAHRRWGRR